MINTKACSSCKEIKLLTDFHKRTKSSDGYQGNCKDCNKLQRKDYYKSATGKANNVTTGRRWSEQMRKKVYEYLLEHPCSCGESDPVVLDFDHDNPKLKTANVSTLVKNGWGWERILEEIAKCTVRCANCHRRRTAEQFNWYSFI